MPQPGEPITLDDPRWLRVVLIHAIASMPTAAATAHRALLDRELDDVLWSTGALLGAGPATPVVTSNSSEAAFVQLVAAAFTEAARALRAAGETDQNRLRWALGATLAAYTGEFGVAAVLHDAARGGALTEEEDARVFQAVGAQLRRLAYLGGNPPDGLPLHAGLAVFQGRAFLRLAAEPAETAERLCRRARTYTTRLSQLKAIFIELLAGVYALSDALHPKESTPWRRGAAKQVRDLNMRSADKRVATDGIRQPRPAPQLLVLVAPGTRPLVVEQVVLASVIGHRWFPDVRDQFSAAIATLGVEAATVASAEARAGAFLMQHPGADLSQGRESVFEHAFTQARVTLQEAAAALTQELKETGELGVLLTRMARGESVSSEERHKIREQLIDLAKVVPSLAIFAAPGGMLLLPLLIKVLPFDLRPSAFRHREQSAPPASRGPGAPRQ